MKRKIAETVAQCLRRLGASEVYMVELHGGEHIVGEIGDKDIDLVVKCTQDLDLNDIERVSERTIAEVLAVLLNGDPYKLLGVPNIIEIHPIDKGFMGRHVFSTYARPLRLL